MARSKQQVRSGRVARRRQRQMPKPAKRSRIERKRDRKGWGRAHYERRRRPHRRGGKSPSSYTISSRPRLAKGAKMLYGGSGPRSGDPAAFVRNSHPGYPWKRPDGKNPKGQRTRRRSK